MKERLMEKSGAAILDAAVGNAIPPPARQPRRAPEYPPRKLAASVTRAPVEKAIVSVEVFRTALQARCVAPLRLSKELKLVLTTATARDSRPGSAPIVLAGNLEGSMT